MKNKRRIFKGRRLGGLIDEVELQWKLRVSSKVAAREVERRLLDFVVRLGFSLRLVFIGFQLG